MQRTTGTTKIKQTKEMKGQRKVNKLTGPGGVRTAKPGGEAVVERATFPSSSDNRTGKQACFPDNTSGSEENELRDDILMSASEIESDTSDWLPLSRIRIKRGGKRSF